MSSGPLLSGTALMAGGGITRTFGYLLYHVYLINRFLFSVNGTLVHLKIVV